jgi:hypothetical protein
MAVKEHFASKVRPVKSGCHIWIGSKFSSGYGRFWAAGKSRRAHRAVWELANGRSVPEGMFVCHHCDNPACVNIAHLYLGTPLDNMRDKVARGRHVPGHKPPGKCGVRGVSFDHRRRKFLAHICRDGKQIYLGSFPTIEPAAAAYAAATRSASRDG